MSASQTRLALDELPKLQRAVSAMSTLLSRPEAAGKVAARAAGNVLKKHFREKNQVPNKKGWKKLGMWAQIRDSVQEFQEGAAHSVVVNDPRFLIKVYGGVITPKVRKAIAIPLQEEFYGVPPSTFGRDRFIPIKTRRGKYLLAEKDGNGTLKWAYVLVKSSNQAADPTALPPAEVLRRAVEEAVGDFIQREARAVIAGKM